MVRVADSTNESLLDTVQQLLQAAISDGVILGMVVYILMQPLLKYLIKANKGLICTYCGHLNEGNTLYKGNELFWKVIMLSYNIVLCLFSFGTFLSCLSVFRRTGFDGVFMYESEDPSQWPRDCIHGLYHYNSQFEKIAYYFYLSKYVEFADTFFLIITNKEVIPLHYFHHLFAAVDMWILHTTKNDSIWIFVFFNSAIHTLMYFYYGASLMGIRFNSLKSSLTLLQIMQLFFGTLLSMVPNLTLACHSKNMKLSVSYWFSFAYTGTLVAMFVHFYITSYCNSTPKKDTKKMIEI